MKKFQLACFFAVLAVIGSLTAPAQAQNYASPAGTGTDCSAASPCSLSSAISRGGLVNCINGGNAFISYNTANSLVVDCAGGEIFGSTGAAALTLTGTSSQVVTLRNLTFAGSGSAGAPPFIKVTGGATLIIENCKFDDEGVFGFGNNAASNAIAVQFLPSSPAAQLIIRDSVFKNNGVAPSTGGGLQVAPTGSGSASVLLERVSFHYNVTSMVLNGQVAATMKGSNVSASRSNGIIIGSGATLDVTDSTLAFNVGAAITVATGGTARLSNNDIKNNQAGISNSGGQALTYSNNRIVGNGSNGTLTPIQGGQ